MRTDAGLGIQIDLDLPDVMLLRKRFFPLSERNPQISASMFETWWMDDLLERYSPAEQEAQAVQVEVVDGNNGIPGHSGNR